MQRTLSLKTPKIYNHSDMKHSVPIITFSLDEVHNSCCLLTKHLQRFDWSVPVVSPGQTPCYRIDRALSVCGTRSSCGWPGSGAQAGHHIYSHTTWPLICTGQSVAVPKNWNLRLTHQNLPF